MPAEHAILGLLALDQGSAAGEGEGGHGYNLARRFADDEPLGEVLRLEPGMLYHHLKKVARVGWVEEVAAAAESGLGTRPPRRRYRLTPDGLAELRRWLGEPVAHTRELRLEFLVKLYFARRLVPERAGRLVAEQRAILERLAASLAAQRRALDQEPATAGGRSAADADPDAAATDHEFRRQVLDLRLAQTEAAAGWLERVGGAEGWGPAGGRDPEAG